MDELVRQRPRIVVVGSYAVGLVMRTDRIPVAGETVLGHGFQSMDGGKGSNQAIACARLGADTAFVAAVGDDAYGDAALALFARESVDITHLRRVVGAPTGTGFIMVDERGDNAIAVDLGANRYLSPLDIDRAERAIAAADTVLVQLEIELETALYALACARRHGVRAILNPAPAPALPLPADALRHVDILTPNQGEAEVLAGMPSAHAADLADALRAAGVGTVVLTLGAEGAWLAGEGGGKAVPAYRVDALDTTGAGDAFSAALAVALAEGVALPDAVSVACAAGAYSVQSLGTVPSYATRAQLHAFIENYPR